MKFCSHFVLIILFNMAACSYRIEHEQVALENIFVSQELLAKISYEEVKRVVFTPSCISCHGQEGNVNLENYENTRRHLEAIKNTTLLSRKMPKSPFTALNQTQLQYLSAWYQAGSPELARDPNPPKPPTVLIPTFASIKENIFVPKCIACHSADGEADRVPLETIDDLINSPLDIVIPNNPDESGLFILIQEGARSKMPPINSGITPVTPEEIAVIKEWINQGAKN